MELNLKETMVIIKNEIKTSEVQSCIFNEATNKWSITFNKGENFNYNQSNVILLNNPIELEPRLYQIVKNNKIFNNIEKILKFQSINHSYYRIIFKNGLQREYYDRDLTITKSCLADCNSLDVFEYLKKVSHLCDSEGDNNEPILFSNKYEKIDYVSDDTALAKYLNPSTFKLNENNSNLDHDIIFPFGCNNSQCKAVRNAMNNQISVIQGPPGTGKTQTILNIIANILIQEKTVQVVSNNNSAIANVLEKLSSEKYNLGFIVAMLGNSVNKENFIKNQKSCYPDFTTWKIENSSELNSKLREQSQHLTTVFNMQEKLAELLKLSTQLQIENKYFKSYAKNLNINIDKIHFKKKLSSDQWMDLWQELQIIIDNNRRLNVWFKLKKYIKYGFYDSKLYKQDLTNIVIVFKAMYYRTKSIEITNEINSLKHNLEMIGKDEMEEFSSNSMMILKDKLARKYCKNSLRKGFCRDDLWKNYNDVLSEYPVVLSTTFSSRSSLNFNTTFDYVIMDEASQVDIAAGALALSNARNAIIVGDTHQLPNIVTKENRPKAKEIFDSSNVDEGYKFTNSFLQSLLDVIPNVPQTTLREHYRCHPKIINFCNEKFYNGELIIMTEDKGEKDVLIAKKTVPGKHKRGKYNQRQIDVIRDEILTTFDLKPENTGIISPYREQINELCKDFKDDNYEIDTVHKYQGREKDNIIISTVDDEISDFVDNPYLLNVAISRAKKKLILVVTGNKQKKERIITELLDYIKYNNFEVSDSNIHSVFDYLYIQYKNARDEFLKKHKKVSDYLSENLMYSLLEDILMEYKFNGIGILCHFPLNMLIRNYDLLSNEEYTYVMNSSTHVDFLLYSKITKKPLLAIEVDGYTYHKAGTKQSSRDIMKEHIFNIYQLPLLRFKTNGSREKEKIVETLNTIVL